MGAAPGYVDAVGVATDGVTFFVGSLFFTTAALLQYLEVANAPRNPEGSGAMERRRLLTWEPHASAGGRCSCSWPARSSSTAAPTTPWPTTCRRTQADRLVWTPDALGSICFLVASGLAWAEVSGVRWSWRPRNLSWSITALNLVGSIAFGASAVGSYVVPDADQPRNATLMNLGTFVGALCFLAGALLLLPERTHGDT